MLSDFQNTLFDCCTIRTLMGHYSSKVHLNKLLDVEFEKGKKMERFLKMIFVDNYAHLFVPDKFMKNIISNAF